MFGLIITFSEERMYAGKYKNTKIVIRIPVSILISLYCKGMFEYNPESRTTYCCQISQTFLKTRIIRPALY
jgi:hypothetical protein